MREGIRVQRDIVWQRIDGLGLEHLRLTSDDDVVLADGMLLAVEEGKPVRGAYSIRCDRDWRVCEAMVRVPSGMGKAERFLRLRTAGDGRWQMEVAPEQWEAAPALEGCIEIDIYPSPFTNTLAIRRLQLAPGASEEITVAFIRLPEFTVQPARQRYTCLAQDENGARYRYEGLETGYAAELPVDAEGLVVEYPDWFRRVLP